MGYELPLAAVVRLIKKSDPNFRVSEKAAEVLRDKLEEFSLKIASKAKEFAIHAHRKTITASDIQLALKNL